MKRIKKTKLLRTGISVLMIITLLFCALSVVSLAADVDSTVVDTVDGITTENATQGENKSPQEYPEDFWGKMMDFISYVTDSKFYQVISSVCYVIMLVVLSILKKATRTDLSSLKDTVRASQSDFKSSVSNKINELIEADNTVGKNVESLKSDLVLSIKQLVATYSAETVTKEEARAIVAGMRSTLEILNVIYQHSSTIPAVIKEQVLELHNNAEKQFEGLYNDDKM